MNSAAVDSTRASPWAQYKQHTVTKIKKVTSGSTRATMLKGDEAAKVIENSQRDIKIAFIR